MDIFAHSLWTNILYRAIPQTRQNRKLARWGIFFGIFPDLFAFTPMFAYIIFAALFLGRPFFFEHPEDSLHLLPLQNLTQGLYSFSHSLVIWAVVLILVWLIVKKFPFALLGWALHILIDIFSHTSQFYATPFLFPISKFKVSVISWLTPRFMLINYGLLLVFYLIILPYFRRRFALKKGG